MSDILDRIEAYKRDEIAAAKAAIPFDEIKARARDADSPRDFIGASTPASMRAPGRSSPRSRRPVRPRG